eukprot:gnl/TRDRNA2_/TRDRNA2_70045_c0_seq1.p1 gnl/TRDRNA2_/TRDRNA2_70045_c0~~gnl/TRDRNA2_/TRDRNA2_70045_c0_seq1.p1  ORF type:complete len:263 (+),score=18.07 gnl/TRDRNA2_/TRDRNA2_70045_c0_seq1:206-994(+)
MPLMVVGAAWMLIPPACFYSPARLKAAEQDQSEMLVEPPHINLLLEQQHVLEDTEGDAACSAKAPWNNARFRVIAATWCVNWWSFNFYAYTAFPMLISKTGPPLEVVSTLYTVESLLATVLTASFWHCLKTNLNVKFFGSAAALCILPPLAICVLGPIHWAFYLLTVLAMNIVCAVSNILLGTVMLRSLPWDLIPVFYSQVAAIGGCISAVSYTQLAIHELLESWKLTVLCCHGLLLSLLVILYLTHQRAILEIWRLLSATR